jgi:hypothetical protein
MAAKSDWRWNKDGGIERTVWIWTMKRRTVTKILRDACA